MRRLHSPTLVVLAVLLATFLGCASAPSWQHPEQVAVWHVVVIRLKDPADADAQRKLIDASYSFHQITGVRAIYVGRNLPGNRPHQNSDFDVAVVMGFHSAADRDAYVEDPIHQKAVNDVLKPLAKDYTFFDFTNEPAMMAVGR